MTLRRFARAWRSLEGWDDLLSRRDVRGRTKAVPAQYFALWHS